ncbi:penicillin-binding protein transpeptidase [Beutenbergia cavernae DSM 12333]|uniref:Beta-lactamase n=1 Tax=Beutenbergia cavernae (strain ATCC BAA-8 / DSM 12333 / CCUG 43141 / JCM 11478 / NBRC 16432 / NCIMB 13614 / HKI 0122) TaxID=471853 RepID=C5BWJ5_BEUC1|nr:penicillin-binding transpeptidase domain-containing protein [Beutenbergia cavernae]ACQ78653.1 penicillin-binding protein transpeptidase [Beutenbergia cavernae DSM 12333]
MTVRDLRAAGGAVVALLVLTGTLTACSPGRPGPGDSAEALASALAGGDESDVGAVTWTGSTPDKVTTHLTDTFAALDGVERTVQVAELEEPGDDDGDGDPDTAAAELAWEWDFGDGGESWTYATTAQLAWDEETETWTAAWSPELLVPGLTPTELLSLTRTSGERGEVVDANGGAIVMDRGVLRIGIDKTMVDAADAPASGLALAELLEFDDPQAFADRVAAAGERAWVEAIIVRVSEPGVDLDAVAAIDGARAIDDTRPLAPTSTFARPILGRAGPATAEIVEESDGAVVADEITGLSGLQRQYDEVLRGVPGYLVEAVREDGRPRTLFERDPARGSDLALTLDAPTQILAEEVLAGVGPASALVAIRPSDGAVLAAASGPGSAGENTAMLGQFAPGSTFKVVTALALLRSGVGVTEPTLPCTPTVTVDGREFDNFPGYPEAGLGDVPLRTVIAQSCNTALIASRDSAPPDALADAAAALGLGVEPSLAYPAWLGSVPTDVDAGGTEHAASMIGQGRVLASPLAMATVAASVVRGAAVTPVLVADADQEPAPEAETPLTDEEATALRELMRAVVTEGSGSLLADVPGEPVSAKSGTAQYGDADPPHTHAWMIATQGDLAVAVFVERGDYGSATSGPIVEAFLRGLAAL